MSQEPNVEREESELDSLVCLDDRPTDVPWTLRDIVYGVLSTVGIFAVLVGALVIGYLAWAAFGFSSASEDMIVQVVFAFEAVLILPAWYWGPRRHHTGWASLGLRRFRPLKGLLAVLVGFGLILVVNLAWTPIMEVLGLSEQPNVLPMFGEGVIGLLVALFLGGVVAPIAEEILFRGFFYAGLRTAWGRGWAIAASSLVFALVHGFAGVIPPIFVMGLILGLVYDYTGSVWPAVILHGAVNGFSFLASFFAQ